MLHLVLDTNNYQVARNLYHRQADGSTEEQGGNGHKLAGITRGDDLRENQLAHVWCEHGQQNNTYASRQAVKESRWALLLARMHSPVFGWTKV